MRRRLDTAWRDFRMLKVKPKCEEKKILCNRKTKT